VVFSSKFFLYIKFAYSLWCQNKNGVTCVKLNSTKLRSYEEGNLTHGCLRTRTLCLGHNCKQKIFPLRTFIAKLPAQPWLDATLATDPLSQGLLFQKHFYNHPHLPFKTSPCLKLLKYAYNTPIPTEVVLQITHYLWSISVFALQVDSSHVFYDWKRQMFPWLAKLKHKVEPLNLNKIWLMLNEFTPP
jgi:hypothetical protein